MTGSHDQMDGEPQNAVDGNGAMVAVSPAMVRTLEMARRVAQTDVGVLLLGESGVGKEVVSRWIHRSSKRAAGPFVAINCAAIPETLLEATLFGFEKGAFTGATQSAPGKFEQAQGGTLLLDEITEMAAGLQAKLLRVLQEREIERVGGRRRIALDLRVIATSNRDPRAAVRQGVLREDLYYRLSAFPLTIPPLRERVEDILPIAERTLARAGLALGGGQTVRLGEDARRALLRYDWPGNVRELENVVQRAAILCLNGVISAQDLSLPPAVTPNAMQPDAMDDGRVMAGSERMVGLEAVLEQNERRMVAEALRQSHGSRKLAAERLGISPRTLRHKLQRWREAGFELPSTED